MYTHLHIYSSNDQPPARWLANNVQRRHALYDGIRTLYRHTRQPAHHSVMEYTPSKASWAICLKSVIGGACSLVTPEKLHRVVLGFVWQFVEYKIYWIFQIQRPLLLSDPADVADAADAAAGFVYVRPPAHGYPSAPFSS